ncbi:GIY-YIG nuclease family protein [Cytobacillus oceanisediminis]|uniref:GIY-YIG nuclease family protein n=1 Tax=Cytobacillus oceanisediminis TaxID=665099 RepID=UPI00254F88FC|nr:GIY-YIG nuclease family protein [Cytobacillus oceanisediminis]MDK7668684.1 GIY-YIG nuclease family protein [Cytobacillus oceanisediminis]
MARMIISINEALYDAVYRHVNQQKLDGEKISLSGFVCECIRKELGYTDPIIKQKGYVYFFQEDKGHTIKIGRSHDPNERFEKLGAKMPFNLMKVHRIETNDMLSTEQLFHDFFKFKRENGEWFALQQREIEWIKGGHYTPEIEASIKGEVG